MTELEYTAQQNKRAIESSIKGIEEALADLRKCLVSSGSALRLGAWDQG